MEMEIPLLPAGNVTIPPNHESPQLGTVVKVRYFYAFPKSGATYQSVYLGPRNNITEEGCTDNE